MIPPPAFRQGLLREAEVHEDLGELQRATVVVDRRWQRTVRD
jgi:hypothetical protein